MAVSVVVGAQWGDEGKGKIVDILSAEADVVARYQGGANAGHTVEIGDRTYVLHLIPSGVFHEHVVSVIGNGVVIDPVALMEEIRTLEAAGISLKGRLKISHNAHLIMPYHKLLDSLYEQGAVPIGTTGRGIGPAYYDKAARTGIRIVDLLDRAFLEEALRRNLEAKNQIIRKVYDHAEMDIEAIVAEYLQFDTQIDEYVTDTAHYLNTAISDGRRVLCEGAQGALLDIDHGTYPFVTSSSPVSGGATIGLGIPPTAIDRVYGVMKAYATRVGLGPFPTELHDETGEALRTHGHEYGSTTGRPRRCGWFDVVAMRYSAMVNGISECCVTKLDVLDHFDEIRLCVAYERNGKALKYFPANARELEGVTPVYETVSGWKQTITGAESIDELPAAARDYCALLEKLTGVAITCVSVGPNRVQTMMKHRETAWSL
jgi:adenylosuccinate synthase